MSIRPITACSVVLAAFLPFSCPSPSAAGEPPNGDNPPAGQSTPATPPKDGASGATKPDEKPAPPSDGPKEQKTDGNADGKTDGKSEPGKVAQRPPTVPGPNDVVHAVVQKDLPRQKFTLFGESFDCELCLDPASRDVGMGLRTEFPEGTAMIFVHPRPRMLNYWMKDCLIDMDIVLIDKTGAITAVHEAVREKLRTKDESLAEYQARLTLYGTDTPAKYVIEFPQERSSG